MSRGIGAFVKKVLEDDTSVLYEYGAYNWNESKYQNLERIRDGSIWIPKSCFSESEIHKKLKRIPSGRKRMVIKRIPVRVDYEKMLRDGTIQVENCSCCWQTRGEGLKVDDMACHILFQVFQQYQKEGEIPEWVSYNV